MTLANYEKNFAENRERYLGELKDLLRFKSISADPSYSGDCRACALWLVSHLTKIGLSARLVESPRHPVVVATFAGTSKDAPKVIFYGHYDVQPPDPLDLWRSPPFEPEIRDNRLYARGAQDNKGQLFYVLKAIETLISRGELACDLTLVLEGEEESGSVGFERILPELKLKGDVLLVSDTGTLLPERGMITLGLRGLIFAEVRIGGLHSDLHSGVHGGMVLNPALELARLLTTLHDAKGKIAVSGYYDDVLEVSSADLKLANDLPLGDEWYKAHVGVLPRGGEKDFTPVERRGFRPTIEVNGMYSGYLGAGSKTIIPSFAVAKLTSRLAGGQNPARCLDLLVHHLEAHAPKDLTFEIVEKGVGGPALLLSAASAPARLAREVIREITGAEALCAWEGASIPVIPLMKRLSGAEPLLVGFGLEEDGIHAPNESFSLDQFRRGYLYNCLILRRLSEPAALGQKT